MAKSIDFELETLSRSGQEEKISGNHSLVPKKTEDSGDEMATKAKRAFRGAA